MTQPLAHARLAPSSADRWGPGGCSASPRMESLYPEDEQSPEARQGTAAHHYVTETLLGRGHLVTVGSLAPNGYPIDVEMIDSGEDFIRDVQDTVKSASDQIAFEVETRVYMAANVHADNWGTPDAYLIDFDNYRIHVWDYKYGHRYVDAFRNWQCLDYLIGVLESIGLPAIGWEKWTFTVTIAQPRNYHPDGPLREWVLSGVQLVQYAAQLQAAAVAASQPDAMLHTGDHCRDCKARHACPALQAVAMSLIDMTLQGQPVDLPPAALGVELRIIRDAIKRLEARAVGLTAQALALASGGVDVPHWRAEYSYGRKRWNVPAPQVIELGKNFAIDLAKPTALTPLQAEKAGMDPALIKAFSETPRGAMALVPYDNADIAKRFS